MTDADPTWDVFQILYRTFRLTPLSIHPSLHATVCLKAFHVIDAEVNPSAWESLSMSKDPRGRVRGWRMVLGFEISAGEVRSNTGLPVFESRDCGVQLREDRVTLKACFLDPDHPYKLMNFSAAPMSAACSLLISPRLPRRSVMRRKRVKSVGKASVSTR